MLLLLLSIIIWPASNAVPVSQAKVAFDAVYASVDASDAEDFRLYILQAIGRTENAHTETLLSELSKDDGFIVGEWEDGNDGLHRDENNAQNVTPGHKRVLKDDFGHHFATLTIADGSTWLLGTETVQRSLTNFLSYHCAVALGLGSHCPRALLLSSQSKQAADLSSPFTAGDLAFFSEQLFSRKNTKYEGIATHQTNGYAVVVEKTAGSLTGIELVNVSRCFSEDFQQASYGACAIPKDDERNAKFVNHLFCRHPGKNRGPDHHPIFKRSCSDAHDIEELVSLSILDTIMMNHDRVHTDQGFTGNIFSTAGPDEPFDFVYIDNAQQFIQGLKHSAQPGVGNYVFTPPQAVETGDYAADIDHWRPPRWQGGFGSLTHNCHIDPKLREVLLTITSGAEFVKAVKASIGQEQLLQLASAFDDALGSKRAGGPVPGGLTGALGEKGAFANRYETILSKLHHCLG
jgi:hypothetical protein